MWARTVGMARYPGERDTTVGAGRLSLVVAVAVVVVVVVVENDR